MSAERLKELRERLPRVHRNVDEFTLNEVEWLLDRLAAAEKVVEEARDLLEAMQGRGEDHYLDCEVALRIAINNHAALTAGDAGEGKT